MTQPDPPTTARLIVIFGPPAVGRASVGHELAQRIDARFFHNHLTVDPVVALFEERHAGRVYFVELRAGLEARLAREGTPLRLALKPAKRDVEAARQHLRDIEGKVRLTSDDSFSYPARHLILDTEALEPAQCAGAILARWGKELG